MAAGEATRMSQASTPYTSCAYIGRNGLCARRCYGGLCKAHRKSPTRTTCLAPGCRRGTKSTTGYCPCTWAQQQHGHRLGRERLAAEAAAREMDAFIRELFDLPAECLTP